MKITVFGAGRSGVSAAKLATKLEHKVSVVSKGSPKEWGTYSAVTSIIAAEDCFSEEDEADVLGSSDLIIISPGIPTTHPALDLAHKNQVSIISEVEFAFRHSDIPVVGITGTNGKTTTTTMVKEALEIAGLSVFCGGNIGIPYCDIFESETKFDYAVIELSSFQLETIESFKPKVALILNITKNHGERYSKFEDYVNAKKRIYMNQGKEDTLIYDENIDLQKFNNEYDFSECKLIGEHNLENFFYTQQTLRALKINEPEKVMQKLINSFRGVEHRLEFVKQINDLKFYNDSKSTNLSATVAAVKAFDRGVTLILGGKLRDNVDGFRSELLKQKEIIKEILLIGESSESLKTELPEFKVESVENISNALNYIKESSIKGNILISPGFPSFDQFENYIKRGEFFKEEVNRLFF